MKKLVLLLVSLALLTGVFGALNLFAGDLPETIVLAENAKLGKVTFTHNKHTEGYKIECKACHHEMKEGETPKPCKACHGVDEKALGAKDAFHQQCKDCHKQSNTEKGTSAPDKCGGCHVKK